MSKVICKGLIYEHDGEIKCIVPNKPLVVVMPSLGALRYSDGAYMGGRTKACDKRVAPCRIFRCYNGIVEKHHKGNNYIIPCERLRHVRGFLL